MGDAWVSEELRKLREAGYIIVSPSERLALADIVLAYIKSGRPDMSKKSADLLHMLVESPIGL